MELLELMRKYKNLQLQHLILLQALLIHLVRLNYTKRREKI